MYDLDARDNLIRWSHRAGASLRYLAGAHGLSASRVHQIVHTTERPKFRPFADGAESSLPSWLQKLSARRP